MSNFTGLLNPKFNIDDMPESELRQFCLFLTEQNLKLNLDNHGLRAQLQKVSFEKETLTKENADLHQKIINSHLLVEQNEELKENIKLLQMENKMLEERNELLTIQVKELQERTDTFKGRDEPITIREAIRVLESFICLDAVGGSKSKFLKGRYNFNAFEKNATTSEKASLENIKLSKGLTKNHLEMMGYLKDCGDYEAHSGRPKLTKDEWLRAIEEDDQEASSVDDEDEKKELLACIEMKKELLAVLETYIPCIPGKPWNIEDPVNKPKKSPELKLTSIGAK